MKQKPMNISEIESCPDNPKQLSPCVANLHFKKKAKFFPLDFNHCSAAVKVLVKIKFS